MTTITFLCEWSLFSSTCPSPTANWEGGGGGEGGRGRGGETDDTLVLHPHTLSGDGHCGSSSLNSFLLSNLILNRAETVLLSYTMKLNDFITAPTSPALALSPPCTVMRDLHTSADNLGHSMLTHSTVLDLPPVGAWADWSSYRRDKLPLQLLNTHIYKCCTCTWRSLELPVGLLQWLSYTPLSM